MIRVTDVYEGFYMSIGNDLPLLIHVIADSHGTPFKQQPRIEDKLSKIACSYLKFILPQDMNKWSYVKTLFSNDINDTDNGGFYYFKGRTFIKKIPLISDPRTQLEVLVPFLNQDEDNNNDKAALLQSQHQVPGFRTVTPRSSRNYCRLKIKALSSNKTFIHKFDPLDTTLSQVREWMETLLHKDLPLNQYKDRKSVV